MGIEGTVLTVSNLRVGSLSVEVVQDLFVHETLQTTGQQHGGQNGADAAR